MPTNGAGPARPTSPGPATPTVAVDHAARGWPVFPVAPGGKLPAIRSAHPDGDPRRGACRGECGQHGHGLWDATTDPAQVRQWERLYPRCNWGLSCGPAALVVIDLDHGKGTPPAGMYGHPTPAGVEDGADALTVLADLRGAHLDHDTLTVTTPSGGTHLYYAAPAGTEVRSSAGKLGWCIDVRAHGGYVVTAGSRTPAGLYVLAHPGPVRPLPAWLLAELQRTGHIPTRPPSRPPAPTQGVPSAEAAAGGLTGRARAYVVAALTRELDAVATAVEGGRNATLNRAAYSVGQLVDPYGLQLRAVADALLEAALHAGLGEVEAKATIRSGLASGRRAPRQATR